MISKPLLKQSCKANGVMWTIITLAVCFMLVCVMLIAGNGNLSKTKVAIESTIIQGEIQSSLEKRAINYYEISNMALEKFDTKFVENLQDTKTNDSTYLEKQATNIEEAEEYAKQVAYGKSIGYMLQDYVSEVYDNTSLSADEQKEILGIIICVLNPDIENEQIKSLNIDGLFASLNEDLPRYDLSSIGSENRSDYISDYALKNSSIFLAGKMVESENVNKTISLLKDYGVTLEQYTEFGFTEYKTVKDIARSVLVNYRANLEFQLDNKKDTLDTLTGQERLEAIQDIKNQVSNSFTNTLLSTLPQEVSDALDDIGQMDMYGILVGSIFFKIAGLLLPIIYIIMTSNSLIAGQVDTGSMAYILSTPTKRKTVCATQALYLIGSIFLMIVLTTITSVVCINIVDVTTSLNVSKLILINLGAFSVLFAMSGICFLASSWFNRSKYCMAIGGGLNIFFLVATILGLFGSPVIPNVIRMETLNLFNYVSIISLFDVMSILNGSLTFIWKFAILIAIGVACYVVAFNKFKKKDLPL